MADDTPATGRTTAPQSPYGSDHVRIGILVLIIGLLVVFGVPLLVL